MNGIQRPTRQVYSNYTPQDLAVWTLLFNRQMDLLQPVVSKEYLYALDVVQFTGDRIPDFQEVNERLRPLTGWSLTVVPNLCPEKEFFEHLSQQRFTATCWLRTLEELDYLEEPDMFHDVFAHVPLLSNPSYVGFFKGLSEIALRHIDNSRAIQLLSRLYWFTIEFGMIREDGVLKIYGAGIISSKGETLHCLGELAQHPSFDIATILTTDYRTDILQDKYFIIDSFEQLYHSLPEIETQLAAALQVSVA